MEILRGDKGSGKTTELVKIANREWKYIVCADTKRVDNIVRVAEYLGLDIPYPLTVRELPLKLGQRIDSVLIDDIEDVLPMLIGRLVDMATTSCVVFNKEGEN